ncbi:LysE family translocator [Flagellimonas allohymeniacidonis]|uniref:LysE family translocator n=1 Tax=Flagellimonas allohymeniacidonis TaxID=2517819 RepID=A0A4Q8QKT7_9FLAO|nr:LysE family translocator [Allomuricauda hymeniacidonis]TAI49413.1 LysE family translocator [Allomuricauda hymeniacidonis]
MLSLDFLVVNHVILIAFTVTSALLALSPGPDNIFVLTQSLAHGVRSGIAVVLGLVSGCIIHTTLLAFGVSEVIKRNDNLFMAIKIAGALYLVYLAYKVYVSDAKINVSSSENAKRKGKTKLFWTGFTMNVLNPKVTIFFLAFFPGFLFSDSLNTVVQFYVLGLLFMLVTLFVFGSIAVLSGSISRFTMQHPKTGDFFKWMQIVVFLGIAVYLFISDK